MKSLPIPQRTGAVTRQIVWMALKCVAKTLHSPTTGNAVCVKVLLPSCTSFKHPCCYLVFSLFFPPEHSDGCPCSQSLRHSIPTVGPLFETSMLPPACEAASESDEVCRSVNCVQSHTPSSHSCLRRLTTVDDGPNKDMTKNFQSGTCHNLTAGNGGAGTTP